MAQKLPINAVDETIISGLKKHLNLMKISEKV